MLSYMLLSWKRPEMSVLTSMKCQISVAFPSLCATSWFRFDSSDSRFAAFCSFGPVLTFKKGTQWSFLHWTENLQHLELQCERSLRLTVIRFESSCSATVWTIQISTCWLDSEVCCPTTRFPTRTWTSSTLMCSDTNTFMSLSPPQCPQLVWPGWSAPGLTRPPASAPQTASGAAVPPTHYQKALTPPAPNTQQHTPSKWLRRTVPALFSLSLPSHSSSPPQMLCALGTFLSETQQFYVVVVNVLPKELQKVTSYKVEMTVVRNP